MRARTLFAAGLVAMLPAACADAPGNASYEPDPTFADELELALFGAAEGSDAAVVSPIELAQPEGAGEAPRVTPVEHNHPVPEATPNVELLGVPVATLAMADMPAASRRLERPDIAGPVDIPQRASAGTDDDDGGFGWGDALGAIGTVIIRGGVVSGRDPCAIHAPGRGGIAIGGGGGMGRVGVLINDRSPRVGPSAPSGGQAGMPRRGAVMPGGIR